MKHFQDDEPYDSLEEYEEGIAKHQYRKYRELFEGFLDDD